MLKIFKNFTKRDWIYIVISICLIVLQVWLDITMPDYTQKLTAVTQPGGDAKMSVVWKNGGMMMLCAVGSLASSLLCGFFVAQVAANLVKTLRTKLFDRITDFSNREIDKFSTPSLITRTTNDLTQIQLVVAMGMQVIVKAPIMAVWALVKMFTVKVDGASPGIAWPIATLVTVCGVAILISVVVAVCVPKFKKIQRLTDDLNDATRENLSGVRVIRAFNAEEYQTAKFEEVNKTITKTHLFTTRAMGLMMPIMTLAMSGLSLAIYWIGALLINNAALAEQGALLGYTFAFSQYALQVVMSFILLVTIFVFMPRAMVSAKRINEVLETETSIIYENNDPIEIEGRKGRIEFRDVSFGYADESSPCIKNLNFVIEPGETFAIIGATGTGKSSLVNLIPRFYDVSAGEVLIDGHNVKEYSQKQLEQTVSVAPQKAILFSGDIKSNVTYGCEDVPDDDPRIARALRIAQATFVDELKDGIHAPVAQGGTNFSGGQKQRMSIARAVFKGSDIVIFDDTFSALDYKTDMLVRKELNENLADTTKIIVAQRIGTIKNADKILVLDKGEAVGLGKHEELLETCPVYKEIALSQLSKEEL